MVQRATICYIDNGREFLMLHRNKSPTTFTLGNDRCRWQTRARRTPNRMCWQARDLEEIGLKVKPVLKGVITFQNLLPT